MSRQIGIISRLRKRSTTEPSSRCTTRPALQEQLGRSPVTSGPLEPRAWAGANRAPARRRCGAVPRSACSRVRPPAGDRAAREPGRRDFVHLSSASRSPRCPFVSPAPSRAAGSRTLREQLHRVGEADLLVQLEELEHVATDAAAEAVEEALVAVDVERRRLLGVERAEALVGRARLLQRHVVLDHATMSACSFRSSMNAAGTEPSVFQFDDGGAATAFVLAGRELVTRRRGRMILEKRRDRAAQLPGPIPVDHADRCADQSGAISSRNLSSAQRLVDRAADHVQVARVSGAVAGCTLTFTLTRATGRSAGGAPARPVADRPRAPGAACRARRLRPRRRARITRTPSRPSPATATP